MAFKKLTGKLGIVNARHLAHRSTFNPNLKLINTLSAMEVDDAVNFLLNNGYANLNILARRQRAYKFKEYPRDLKNGKYYIPTLLNGYSKSTFTNVAAKMDKIANYDKALYTWWLNEARLCPGAQFKIAFFLHIQFICGLSSNSLASNIFAPYDYLELINFFVNRSMRAMTKRLAFSDAMTLFYNNYNNDIKTGIDENLGREIMELFTVQNYRGKPPFDPKGDVKSSSRVISGFKAKDLKNKTIEQIINERIASMDRVSGVPLSTIKISSHDPRNKTFGPYFKKQTINGSKTVSGALKEKDQLVDMLFKAPNTAEAYAYNLYRYFVYSDVKDAQDLSIIKSLKESLVKNDFNLHLVLFELFTSREFYDLTDINGNPQSIHKQGAKYIGGKIKSPLEFSMILLDHLKLKQPYGAHGDPEGVERRVSFYNRLVRMFCTSSGMPLFNVAIDGYQFAFRQPEYDRSWVTTNSVLARQEHVKYLVVDVIDAKKFIDSTFKNPKNADGLLVQMVNYFLPRPYSKDSLRFKKLKDIMLAGLDEKSWPYEYDSPGIEKQLEATLIELLTSPDYLVL